MTKTTLLETTNTSAILFLKLWAVLQVFLQINKFKNKREEAHFTTNLMLAGMSAAAIKCSGNSAGRVEFHLSAHPPNQRVLFFFFLTSQLLWNVNTLQRHWDYLRICYDTNNLIKVHFDDKLTVMLYNSKTSTFTFFLYKRLGNFEESTVFTMLFH